MSNKKLLHCGKPLESTASSRLPSPSRSSCMLPICQLKNGKAQGPDNIPPEFLIHCGPRCLKWLREFYSNCFSNLTVPKIWCNATVIAIPKLNKPTDDPKNYRPISLLCVPFKLLEKLILARLEPIIYPHLPDEQAGSAVVEGLFIRLSTLVPYWWHWGSLRKGPHGRRDLGGRHIFIWHGMAPGAYLEAIPDRHPVRFISIIISNRSFTLKTSDGQVGRLRRLKMGSTVLILSSDINIYLSDLPFTSSAKYAYADDLALLYSNRNWTTVENTLNNWHGCSRS